MNIGVMIHVVAGSLAIVSGYVAVFAAKGARLHRRSGVLFVGAMVTMGITGAVMAARRTEYINVLAGSLAAYLVSTALTTVRRPASRSRRLDAGLMLAGVGVGVAGFAIGYRNLAAPVAGSEDVPAALPFIFGTIALLSAASDLRMLRPAGVRGPSRLRRHLWRMCAALFIAAASFFLGQADEIPEPLRIFPLLAIPAFLPLLLMPYWLWRVRARKPRAVRSAGTVPPRLAGPVAAR
jgi:uncharacterized membrane protein